MVALVAGEADLVVAARVAAGKICATIAVPHLVWGIFMQAKIGLF